MEIESEWKSWDGIEISKNGRGIDMNQLIDFKRPRNTAILIVMMVSKMVLFWNFVKSSDISFKQFISQTHPCKIGNIISN